MSTFVLRSQLSEGVSLQSGRIQRNKLHVDPFSTGISSHMRIIQSSNIFITPRVMRMACLPTKPLNSVKEKGIYGTARYVVEVEVMENLMSAHERL